MCPVDTGAATAARIVVAEDSALIRAMIKASLRGEDWDVRLAADGQEALDLLAEEPADIIISDWQMPRVDGLELCRAVRADPAHQDARFIMITAEDGIDRVVEALDAGADDFLRKPFEPLELLARVRASVRISGLQAALRSSEAEHRALATEQIGLANVATAVATGAQPTEVFDQVAREVATLLGAEAGGVARFDGEEHATLVGGWAALPSLQSEPGTVLQLDAGESVTGQVRRTGRTARIDDYDLIPGAASRAESVGRRSSIAAPVHVAGELWGTVGAISIRKDAFSGAAGERLERFAGLVALAIANAESQRQLTELASRDPLTGVANRRVFTERLSEEISRARRHGVRLCLALFDIDHFKRVNDTFGHPAGDAVLIRMAEILAAQARSEDVVARIGGEEFAWILPETELDGAVTAVERVRLTVETEDFPEVGSLTVSCGIAAFDEDDPDRLTATADEALYRAKREGRNRCVVAQRIATPVA